MLLSWNFYQADERLQHKPHNKFSHYPQSNGLAEKYVQIVKTLFYKAQEEGADLYKNLMIYRNTPLSSQLQSPMQILHSWTAKSQLPMSNVARKQHGLGPEQVRVKSKNEQLPLTWPTYRPKCDVPRSCHQKMVSSYYYKSMSRTQKLQNKNKRWHHLQEDTKPSETIPTTTQ